METTIRSSKSSVRPFVFALIAIVAIVGAFLIGNLYANQTKAQPVTAPAAAVVVLDQHDRHPVIASAAPALGSALYEQRKGEWLASSSAAAAYQDQREGEWTAGQRKAGTNCEQLPTAFEQARCMGIR
jgi:hypothetical protein